MSTKTAKRPQTKQVPSQRIFSMYQRERKRLRSSWYNSFESYGAMAGRGSRFNTACSYTAMFLGITMEQARQGIYEGYAAKHGVSVDEARKHFEEAKAERVAAHEERVNPTPKECPVCHEMKKDTRWRMDYERLADLKAVVFMCDLCWCLAYAEYAKGNGADYDDAFEAARKMYAA